MNFKDSKSIYLQIADRIEDEIMQHTFVEGGRIPSVREYAASVEVNANTVMRSYEYLQNNNIIQNKRGIGYFVSKGAERTIRNIRKQTFLTEFVPEFFRQLKLLDISPQEILKNYHPENTETE